MIYVYVCSKCKDRCEESRRVDLRSIGPKCQDCNVEMELEIQPVNGVVRNPAVPKRGS